MGYGMPNDSTQRGQPQMINPHSSLRPPKRLGVNHRPGVSASSGLEEHMRTDLQIVAIRPPWSMVCESVAVGVCPVPGVRWPARRRTSRSLGWPTISDLSFSAGRNVTRRDLVSAQTDQLARRGHPTG
jgi:hypothetical protein